MKIGPSQVLTAFYLKRGFGLKRIWDACRIDVAGESYSQPYCCSSFEWSPVRNAVGNNYLGLLVQSNLRWLSRETLLNRCAACLSKFQTFLGVKYVNRPELKTSTGSWRFTTSWTWHNICIISTWKCKVLEIQFYNFNSVCIWKQAEALCQIYWDRLFTTLWMIETI